ncbi:DUF4429 domain-containing protein [Nocardiopsis suaedae]|uniref:DUF4429 domain-containing protein n=1 Tax=Nocardiopsis suaedae TaxID=3018444 RepID=A0ABT4TKU8_9ACTN|nr:DUF4429 domain-containing protein [Nocardiopsis suaedae]MDA2805331.1 DUF4429 domain-containing protein [Nocardiopsis suaedae]
MDELAGKQATWSFDDEKVVIQYASGWLAPALHKALARSEVPMAAIAGVEFRSRKGGAMKKGWELRLRLHERTDPYSFVGAALSRDEPFLLTGDAKQELVAEYHADQIRFAAEQAGPPEPGTAARLVAPLPLHIQVHEGTAAFDGASLSLQWAGNASGPKRARQRMEYPLEAIEKVEWVPSDGWEYGLLRVVERGGERKAVKPAKDLACLLFDEGAEQGRALLMAATVTAHLWAAEDGGRTGGAAGGPPLAPAPPEVGAPPSAEQDAPAAEGDDPDPQSRVIYARIRELGRLHAEGLLTDEEFSAKKAELLDRL